MEKQEPYGAPPLKGYASTKQLAAHLGVDSQTVRRLAREGKIPFTYVGVQKRFLVREVEAALAEETARRQMRGGK